MISARFDQGSFQLRALPPHVNHGKQRGKADEKPSGSAQSERVGVVQPAFGAQNRCNRHINDDRDESGDYGESRAIQR